MVYQHQQQQQQQNMIFELPVLLFCDNDLSFNCKNFSIFRQISSGNVLNFSIVSTSTI